jgi:hypothetical protein
MPTCQDGDEQLFDGIVLSDNDISDLLANFGERILEFSGFGNVIRTRGGSGMGLHMG